jgi:hypothetical protein
MNLRRGLRRAMVFISILYWCGVVKLAILSASWGPFWYGPDPTTLLIMAAGAYVFFFGIFWTIEGFLTVPRRRL